MKRNAFFYWLVLLSFHSALFSQVKLGGSFENTSFVSGGNEGFNFDNATQLQLLLNYRNSDIWRLYSDIRLTAYYGFDGISEGFFSIADKSGKYALGIDISRLHLKANFGSSSFTVGRDYLSFGSPSLFNTVEWYKNFSLLDPTQTKPAINLVSFTAPIGAYGKFKTFIGGDDSWEDVLSGSELIVGTSGFETGLIYQYKGNNTNIIGTFFKVDALVAITGSYAFHLNNALIKTDIYNKSHEASITFDYSFPIEYMTLLVNQSMYFNSLGAKSIDELASTPYGDYFFRSMLYSYSSLSLGIDDFTSVGIDVIVSMVDASGAVLPSFQYSIDDGLSLDIGAGIYFGEQKAEFSPLNDGIPTISALIGLEAKF